MRIWENWMVFARHPNWKIGWYLYFFDLEMEEYLSIKSFLLWNQKVPKPIKTWNLILYVCCESNLFWNQINRQILCPLEACSRPLAVNGGLCSNYHFPPHDDSLMNITLRSFEWNGSFEIWYNRSYIKRANSISVIGTTKRTMARGEWSGDWMWTWLKCKVTSY